MKNFKKLMALVIAAVMVVGTMNMMAFADPTMNDTFDSEISVTGLTAEDKVEFYQIIKWVGITEDNKDDPNVVGGWEVVDAYKSVIDADLLKAILVDDPDTDAENDPRGITSELAGQIARAAGTVDFTVASVASDTATMPIDQEGKQGMYMAIITPKDVDTVYNPVFVSSDYFANDTNTHGVPESSYADKAAAKKSTLNVVKTAENAADYNHDNGDTTKVGDIITFTVTTQIPRYGKVYENPTFNVHDELTDLELVSIDSVVADGVTLTKGTEYDDNGAKAGDSSYLIEFDSAWLKGLSKITPVTITYKAKVTSAAAQNINEEDNQVEIIYSHNPTDKTGSDFKAKKDTTQHYTFTIDAEGLGLTQTGSGKKTSEIVKVGLDGEGNPVYETSTDSEITPGNPVESPLAQAVFGVYKTKADADAGTPLYTNDVFTTGTVTTGADGRMTISGLDAGEYWIKEITAPAGFIKDPSAHKIEIIPTMSPEIPITEYYKADATGDNVVWQAGPGEGFRPFTYNTRVLLSYQVKFDGEVAATHTFKNPGTSTAIEWSESEANEIPSSIINTKGVELPSTGGMGTTLFYAIGAILVLGAGILLVSKRRMSAN